MIHWHVTTDWLQFRLVGNGEHRRVEMRARRGDGVGYMTVVEWPCP